MNLEGAIIAMRKFYSEVWRLAIHFREPTDLDEFKEPLKGDLTVRIIHETDDFILLETDELVGFANLVDDAIRGTSMSFLTIKQILK